MQTDVKLSVSFAWWLKPYLRVFALCAVLSGRVPDSDKLAAKIARATRVTVR